MGHLPTYHRGFSVVFAQKPGKHQKPARPAPDKGIQKPGGYSLSGVGLEAGWELSRSIVSLIARPIKPLTLSPRASA